MSTVIKAGEAGPILQHLSTVYLADHLANANAVMEQASREAARTMADAHVDAQRIREEARQQGYQAGYDRGHSEGREAGFQAAHDEAMEGFRQEHANVVQVMQDAVASIDAVKEDLTIAARRDLLDLSISIARKLTFAIGDLHREAAVQNLDRALRLAGSKTDLRIRAHPRDITSMEKFAESVLSDIRDARTVSIVGDETMAAGGCKVESERTNVDASLETQVRAIVSMLMGGHQNDD